MLPTWIWVLVQVTLLLAALQLVEPRQVAWPLTIAAHGVDADADAFGAEVKTDSPEAFSVHAAPKLQHRRVAFGNVGVFGSFEKDVVVGFECDVVGGAEIAALDIDVISRLENSAVGIKVCQRTLLCDEESEKNEESFDELHGRGIAKLYVL